MDTIAGIPSSNFEFQLHTKKGARVDVLCFDGCMAYGLNHLTQEERRALLDAAEVFVENQGCVPVTLAEKSLNPEQWPLDYAEDDSTPSFLSCIGTHLATDMNSLTSRKTARAMLSKTNNVSVLVCARSIMMQRTVGDCAGTSPARVATFLTSASAKSSKETQTHTLPRT